MVKLLARTFLVVALLFSCVAAHCGIGTVPAGADGGAAADAQPSFVHCTTDAVKQIALGIQGDIATALATGDYEAALAALVAQFTADEVKCALEIFIGGNARKASADPLLAQQIARALAYLQAHP